MLKVNPASGLRGPRQDKKLPHFVVRDDMVRLLDHLAVEKAVFCGHDWGGIVVWQMGLLHPDRTAGAWITLPSNKDAKRERMTPQRDQ